MIESFSLLAVTVSSIAGCGIPLLQTPLPVLSDRPLDPSEPLARGVVRVVLKESQTTAVFDSFVSARLPDAKDLIEKSWPDSARAAFRVALAAGPVDSATAVGLPVD